MSAANALLAAIHARLAADPQLMSMIATDGIRDRLLPRPVLPTLVIGEIETRDYSTATEAGEEHRLVLEVWSEAAGRREAEEIAERVRVLLQDAALTLSGHVLVSLAHERTRTRRQAKTACFASELRFRAVTEPLEPVSP
ncbi:DUF3168 domain-containing protein [Rhizobium halophilum]|uniref:DUF3168 domain-containing protein n=1 Tax=Rhizobium halophilum TaxID=2846852 RepID=UPI001EFC4AA4|nr:DUF3168 domain-containing protein [Rhizobium halophilum]MCF6370473.1 DUF3168 domain-containing protein [Rhizobium halophilum]